MINPIMMIGADLAAGVLEKVLEPAKAPANAAFDRYMRGSRVQKNANHKITPENVGNLMGATVEVKKSNGISVLGVVDKIEDNSNGPMLSIRGHKYGLNQLQRVLRTSEVLA